MTTQQQFTTTQQESTAARQERTSMETRSCRVVLSEGDFKRDGPVPRGIRRALSNCGLTVVDAAKGYALVDPGNPDIRDSALARDAFREFLNIGPVNFSKICDLNTPALVLAFPHRREKHEHLLFKAESLRRELGLPDEQPVVFFWKNRLTRVFPDNR